MATEEQLKQRSTLRRATAMKAAAKQSPAHTASGDLAAFWFRPYRDIVVASLDGIAPGVMLESGHFYNAVDIDGGDYVVAHGRGLYRLPARTNTIRK